MKFAGTLSIPDDAFIAVLMGASRSLKQHGFLDIVLIGDSGNYQSQLKEVAQRLNREWATSRTRVHHVAAYYRAASDDFAQALRARGMRDDQIGTHAGLADTSLMMALDPSHIRVEKLRGPGVSAASGVSGDPAESSAALGRLGTGIIVDTTV